MGSDWDSRNQTVCSTAPHGPTLCIPMETGGGRVALCFPARPTSYKEVCMCVTPRVGMWDHIKEGTALLGAMKRRILGYLAPPRHRRMVIGHTCSAALQHFQTKLPSLGGGLITSTTLARAHQRGTPPWAWGGGIAIREGPIQLRKIAKKNCRKLWGKLRENCKKNLPKNAATQPNLLNPQ